MAPMIVPSDNNGRKIEAGFTLQVFFCALIAATGGLMFGYDIGISGGVTGMDDFLSKFFPEIYIRKHHAREDNYCKYNSPTLQLFTSSLYLAAIVASFVASKICSKYGRRFTMRTASVFFLVGALFNLFAQNLIMLIIGRLLLGVGVGFGNQAVPLFISEIAPPRLRGGFNIMFQLMITIGILAANIVNYFTDKVHPLGWRISLGGASIPALILLLGSLFIVETPTSLIERGKLESGKKTLKKIRGTDNIDAEFVEILHACELASKIKHPFKELMKRSSRPQLVCGTILQVFQQFTGINVIMFYAPVLFQTMGLGNSASLLSSVVTGLVNVVATFIAIILSDRAGRRVLLIEAAVQMIIAQVATGGILAANLGSTNSLHLKTAYIVVVLVAIFVSGFAWSWGPLGWLIPSEIYPLETRTAGFFFAVSMNMFCTFIIAQAFLTMLCHMRAGIFFFFVAWILVMGTFAIVFLPETKGVPIDEMNERVWKKHWYWKKYMNEDDDGGDTNFPTHREITEL